MPKQHPFIKAIAFTPKADLSTLAVEALPLDNDDWGTVRQVCAENRFYDAVEQALPRKDWDQLESYLLKATTEEGVAEALRVIAAHEDRLRHRQGSV